MPHTTLASSRWKVTPHSRSTRSTCVLRHHGWSCTSKLRHWTKRSNGFKARVCSSAKRHATNRGCGARHDLRILPATSSVSTGPVPIVSTRHGELEPDDTDVGKHDTRISIRWRTRPARSAVRSCLNPRLWRSCSADLRPRVSPAAVARGAEFPAQLVTPPARRGRSWWMFGACDYSARRQHYYARAAYQASVPKFIGRAASLTVRCPRQPPNEIGA
jgi:hypothetical protein